MEIRNIATKELHLLEGNPRKIVDPKAIDKLVVLIEEHGFQNPLQVYNEKDGSWTILCGNHRYEAGKRLGMGSFPCIEYRGTRAKAYARAVSDNQASTWTEFDFSVLKDVLAMADTGEYDVEALGFDQEELEQIFEYESIVPRKATICPECGHEIGG